MINKLVKILFLSIIFSISGILTSCEQDEVTPVAPVDPNSCDTSSVSFKNFIKPYFDKNCISACHAAGSAIGDFTTLDGIISRKGKMPAKLEGSMNQYMVQDSTLSCSILKINAWIIQGTKDN